ncbi:hypothetical protein EPO17_00215 [Patescibacteria group bacterium]|nr:MAG: hypothetical protein EPO17_00215 [Patescibacteria group bacterium]
MKTVLLMYGPMLVVGSALMVVNFKVGKSELVLAGLKETGKMIVGWLPLIALMFLVTGQANALIARYMDNMREVLSGTRGMLAVIFAGVITPGTMTSAPIIKQLWALGHNHGPIIVYFLASNLVNIQITLLRAPMLGKDATMTMFWVGVVVTLACAGFFLVFRR